MPQATAQATQEVTAQLHGLPRGKNLSDPRLHVECTSCGQRYSAAPGDYWNLSDDQAMLCACDGDNFCVLVERRYITGTTPDGQWFHGSVSVDLMPEVTIGDLRRLNTEN